MVGTETSPDRGPQDQGLKATVLVYKKSFRAS